jgi:hypothetical protein
MAATRRRAVGVATALALVWATALVGFASGAAADEGLTVAAQSTYVLDTESDEIRATVTIDLVNVSPDRVTDDGVYSYFFTAFSVPVPAGATDVRAVSDGSTLTVARRGTDDPSTALLRLSFPELTFEQSRRIDLTFTVPGAPPRSADSTRVGKGYATFVASSPGDPGRNEVRVVVPSGTSFTSTSDGFERTGSGDTDTWTSTSDTEGGGIWAVVSLRDPAQADEQVVDAAGTALVLESFPGDQSWTDFVADVVTDGIPALEDLVGNPWPGGLQRIREDATPSLRGYDGWFDPSGDEIVVGEALDDDLILHELSHAWLSGERFDERWQYEGLAQVVSERAVRATGGTPEPHQEVSPTAAEAVPLNTWGGGAGSRSTAVDAWAYPASYQVASALLGDLDDDTFAAVVGAGVRGERAYDPPGTPDPTGVGTSWQRWLDLVETRGGTTGASDVLETWVLTDEQRADLDERAREREAYLALDVADGEWSPPEGLRDAMTAWDFERAASVREAVSGLGDEAMAVQEAARAAGLAVPAPVRDSYEDAAFEEQYAALERSLPAAARAVTSVAEATEVADAERSPFGEIGSAVLGLENDSAEAVSLLDAGRVPEAQEAADRVRSRAAWALPVGVGLPVAALVVVVGGAVILLLVLRRRSEHAQHPGVAQGVGLDPLEVQELRDPLVVGPQQLDVHRGVDRLALDRGEPVPTEEAGLEGEAEQSRETELLGPQDETLEDAAPQPVPEERRLDREGADLTEVLPEHVQRPAADDATG